MSIIVAVVICDTKAALSTQKFTWSSQAFCSALKPLPIGHLLISLFKPSVCGFIDLVQKADNVDVTMTFLILWQ